MEQRLELNLPKLYNNLSSQFVVIHFRVSLLLDLRKILE